MATERMTERLPRLPEVAQVRTGGERGSGHGGRGKVLDHWRLTTAFEDVAMAAHAAYGVVAGGADAGGLDSLMDGSMVLPFTPTNQAGEPTGNEGFQVEIRRQLPIMIPPVQYNPYEETMVMFSTGGIKRRCDTQTCWIPGEEGRQPCICAGLPDDDNETRRCEQQTRFSFILVDIRLGMTNFYTKSPYARGALADILDPIMTSQRRRQQDGEPMAAQIPAWLIMAEKTANRAAAKSETNPRGKTRFWSPVLMPIITPRQMMGPEASRMFEGGPGAALLPPPPPAEDIVDGEAEVLPDAEFEPGGVDDYAERISQATDIDHMNAIWGEAEKLFPRGSAEFKTLLEAVSARGPVLAAGRKV